MASLTERLYARTTQGKKEDEEERKVKVGIVTNKGSNTKDTEKSSESGKKETSKTETKSESKGSLTERLYKRTTEGKAGGNPASPGIVSQQGSNRRRFADIYGDLSAAEERVKGYQSEIDSWASQYGATGDNIMDTLATKYGAQKDESGSYIFSEQSSLDEFNRLMEELSGMYDQYNAGITSYNDVFNQANTYDWESASAELDKLQKRLDEAKRDADRASSAFRTGTELGASGKEYDFLKQDYEDKQAKYNEIRDQVVALNQDIKNAEFFQNNVFYSDYLNKDGIESYTGEVKHKQSEYMTEDERRIYNYIYAQEGAQAAQEYMDHLKESLNYREGTKRGEDIRGIENDIGRFLATGAHGVQSGLENFGRGIGQLFTEEQLATSPTQYASSYIMNDLHENGTSFFGMDKTWGELGYEGASVISNMAPSILVSALLGPAGLGASSAVAGAVGSATMGLSAGGNAYTQALSEGYTEDMARTYGTMVGASEGALQYLLGGINKLGGAGNLSNKALAKVASIENGLLRASAAAGVKATGEIAEEELQNFLEPLYRTVIFGEEYTAPEIEDIVYTAVLTFLTTGVIEGGDIANYASNKPAAYGKELKAAGSEALQGLVESGLESAADTESRALAENIAAKQAAGKEVNDWEVGRLQQANEAAIRAEATETASETLEDAAREVNKSAQAAQETRRSAPYNANVLGYGEHGRAALKSISEQAEVSVDQANTEFHLPYLRGLSNMELSDAGITSDTQLRAFNAGKMDRIQSMNLDAERSAFATVHGKESGLVQSEASKKYDKKAVAVLNKASKAFGTKTMLVDEIWQKDGKIVPKGTEGANEADAAMQSNGVMLVSLNAGDPLYTLTKHEFTHRFQQLAPAEYQQYRDAVMRYVVAGDAVAATSTVERYQNRLGLNVNRSADEIAADFSAYLLKDVDEASRFFDSLLNPEKNTAEQVKKNRNMLERFIDAARDFIKKIKQAFGGDKSKMDAAAQEAFGGTVEQLQELEKLWKQAAEASAKAVQKKVESGTKQEYTGANKNDAMFSRKGYWRSDLTSAQMKDLVSWVKYDIKTSENSICDTANWTFRKFEGLPVFAIYSTQNESDPTILYEVKGEQAEYERDILRQTMGELKNGESIDGKPSAIGEVLGRSWVRKTGGTRDGNGVVGRGRNAGNAGVLRQQSGRRPSAAFESVLRNLLKDQQSEVTDATTGDALFSMKKDSNGNSLSKEQQEYFKDSKMRDADGNLLVVYHGTRKGGFTTFRDWAYLTASKDYAKRYADRDTGETIYELYANMTKPFDTRLKECRDLWRKEFYGNYSRTELQESGLPDWTDGYDLAEWIEENEYDFDGILLDEGADIERGEVKERGISYVVRSSEQIKNTTNKNPTDDPDIRFSMKDSAGNKLSQEQAEYFKDSKVRDEDGNLKVVYHGSPAQFTKFSYDFMGSTGSAEGRGFYFTDKKAMAEGYQRNGGQLMEGYLSITKPLSLTKKTMKRAELTKLLKALDPTGDDIASNYDLSGGVGYPSKAWYTRAMNDTVRMIWDGNDNDADILAEIANSGGSNETVLKTAKELLGYDGYIADDKYDGASVYVAFSSEQFKNADNLTPTSDPDVRFSMKKIDREYIAAIENGDMTTVRRMVSEAAIAAGFADAVPEHTLAYKTRTGKAPKKTIKVYKVFTVTPDGKPTALFVSGTATLPQDVWLDAQDTWHFTAKNGKEYVPSTQNPYTDGGKTGGQVEIPNDEVRQELIRRGFLPEGSKAKNITALAYRPGWHAGDLPFFPQGGMKREGSNYPNIHRYNQVVFECELDADYDYTEYARSQDKAKKKDGTVNDREADLQEMPTGGYYKYATNPLTKGGENGTWFISGSLKIGRALTQEECDRILAENGFLPQEWEQGTLDLASLGYTGQQHDAARKTLAPITYDDAGNIIPLSQRFNPEVNDIRYSTKGQSDLLAENAKLKEVNAALREQFKTTKFAKVDKKSLDTFTRKLLRDYESGADITDTRDALDALYTYIANGENGESPVWQEAYSRAYEVAKDILESAVTLNDDIYREYSGLRQELRTRPIKYDKSLSNDLGGYENIEDFRRANFGRIKMANDGTPVNMYYADLATRYPELFDEYEYTNSADQLNHIAEVLDRLQPTEVNPYSYNMREAATWLANDIMERFYELPQAKPTFADKAQQKLTKQVVKDAKKLEKLREQKNERIQKLIETNREKVKQTQEKERAKREDAIRDLKEHYKAKEGKANESRKAKEMRAKILRHTTDLSKKLLRANDKNHIPQELQGAVAKLLECINMESNYTYDAQTDSYKKNDLGSPTLRTVLFANLRDIYTRLANELTIDPDLLGDDGLLSDVAKLADRRLADMTYTELETVWNAIRAIEASIQSANKTFNQSRYATISEWADAIYRDNAGKKDKVELDGPGGSLGKLQKLTGIDMMTPEAYLHRLGKSGDGLFRLMRDAQDDHIRKMKEVSDFTHEALKGVDVRKLEDTMHTVKLGGQDVKLSTAQIMELYVLMRREQAREHIMVGGILPDVVSKGGLKKIARAKPVRGVQMSEMSAAFDLLTDEQKKVAETLQEYASTQLSKWGNEAAMKVYNYEKFGEKNYWTIRVNRQETNSSVQKDTQVTSVAGRGFAKGTKPHANNSVMVGSIFDTFATHASEMATYAAWLAPMEDINRVRNFTFKSGDHTVDTVKGIIDAVHGKQGTAYLSKLMSDLSNGVKGTHGETAYMSTIVGNYKAASVGANLRVIIQQPTAVLRALDMIDPQYLVAGVRPSNGWKKAKQYAPIAQWKDWGYFDINTGRQMKDVLFDSDSALNKVRNASMIGASAADSLSWGLLWNAVETETKHKRKDLKAGTEEFYKAVAERFAEVVDHTQVVDGILQRSHIMRSADGLTKMATSFMGEPTKQYNMMLSAVYDAMHGDKDARREGKKKLARATLALAIAGVVNAMAQSVIDAVRDDDKEKEWQEKWLEAMLGLTGEEKDLGDKTKAILLEGNLGNTINPAAYIPFVKDVLSLLRGYDVSRMDMESIEKTLSAGQNMVKALNGEGKYTIGSAAANLFAEAARLLGIPVANLKREIKSFAMLSAVQTDNYLLQYRMEKASLALNYSGNSGAFMDILFNAYQHDREAYDIIYKDMIESGYDKDKLANGMETRMKKAESVEKVGDLEQRYLHPDQQTKYDQKAAAVQSSNIWRGATEEHRDALEDKLYHLVTGSKTGEELREKIDEGRSYGLSETDYLLYTLALDMYDQPNKNGEYGGTPTSAEKAAAIESLGNLSDGAIAYLWDTKQGYEAFAGGADMGAFVDRIASDESVSVEKLLGAKNAGMSDEEYYGFLDALEAHDTPTESGKYGTFTQDEAKAAIASLPGLTREQRAYLWQSMNSSWKEKNNPWR